MPFRPNSLCFGWLRPTLVRLRPMFGRTRPNISDFFPCPTSFHVRTRPKMSELDQTCPTLDQLRRCWPTLGDFGRSWCDFGHNWPELVQHLTSLGRLWALPADVDQTWSGILQPSATPAGLGPTLDRLWPNMGDLNRTWSELNPNLARHSSNVLRIRPE